MSVQKIVDIELAKKLKEEGYSIPTEYFYQDIDLPYSEKGLKKTKNGERMNHNNYDDFIYSAPMRQEAIEWLIGKKMYNKSTMILKLNKEHD